MHKVSTASAFMRSENAVEFLGTYHQIKFETDDCKRILTHKETNEEVRLKGNACFSGPSRAWRV